MLGNRANWSVRLNGPRATNLCPVCRCFLKYAFIVDRQQWNRSDRMKSSKEIKPVRTGIHGVEEGSVIASADALKRFNWENVP
jgi:hypothetical protein